MNNVPKGSICTFSNKVVNPTQLKVEDIVFNDLVKSISNLARFNGHLDDFYSVAQHSVLVAEFASKNISNLTEKRDIKLAGLCHDLSEGFIGDIAAPVKPSISICAFGQNMNIREYEKIVTRLILKSIDLYRLHELIEDDNGSVHFADRTLCNSESYYFRGYTVNDTYPVLKDKIKPLPPKESYKYFMEYWNETTNQA